MWKVQLCNAGRFSAVGACFFLPISTTLTEVAIFTAVTCQIVSGETLLKIRDVLQKRSILLSLSLFALLAFGVVYSTAPTSDALSVLGKYWNLLLLPILVPVFANNVWRFRAVHAFLAATTLIAILSYARGFDLLSDLPAVSSGTAIFHNHITQNVLMSFAAFIWATKARSATGLWQYIFALAAVFSGATLCFVAGRTGYLILPALLTLLLVQFLAWRGLLLAVLANLLLLGGACLSCETVWSRLEASINEVNSPSPLGRYSLYRCAAALVREKPFTGWGTGSFRAAANQVCSASFEVDWKKAPNNPHNEYFHLLVQLGPLGLLLFILLLAALWRDSHAARNPYMAMMGKALVLTIAIGCLVNSHLLDFTEGYLFAIFGALVLSDSSSEPSANQSTGDNRSSSLD